MNNKKLKILAVSAVFPPEWEYGGTPITAYEVSKHLIERGHLVMSVATGSQYNKKIPLLNIPTTWNDVPIFYGGRSRYIKPFYSKPMKQYIENTVKQYDVVSIRSSWTHVGRIASNSCISNNTPYIAYAEGNFETWAINTSKVKKSIFWNMYDKKYFSKAKALVALTKSEADSYINMGLKNRIEIIPNGINTKEYQYSSSHQEEFSKSFPYLRDKEYFLFLSRIHPKKGIENLIIAFKKYTERNEMILVIAGTGDNKYVDTIKILISSLGMQEKVLLTGMVIGSNKIALFHNTAVFILPSFSEGFTITLLEAMACKRPIIYTHGCNFPELSNSLAGLVTNPNPDDLYKAMMKLKDDKVRRELSTNAYNLVDKKYSWKIISKLTEDLLCSVAS